MLKQWYAINSKPYKEEMLWQQLMAREIENFYPRIAVKPVNPRSRKIRPYFPGYLFVFVDLLETGLSTLQWMPYAKGLVTFGGEPAIVPEALISKLKQRISYLTTSGGDHREDLQKGDEVLVNSGPFSGYEAIFNTHISGHERVQVLLRFLNTRQVTLELDEHQIQKINRR